MPMVRLNVARRHTPPVTERVENVDLDEKIRRIREANKERERRFLEVEQDKKLALMSTSSNEGSDEDNTQKKVKKEPKHAIMKGIHCQAVNKKRTTGRGQRLLEMSHRPLKAVSFESRTKEMRVPEQSLSYTITLKSRCRSNLRDKIKLRSKECRVPVDANENIETKDGSICNHNEKLDCIPEKECNENTAGTLNENLSHQNEETNTNEFDTRTQDPAEIETIANTESSVAPFETNSPDPEETQEVSDSVEKQETVKVTAKSNKPRVKVDLKKTVSSSSFDESIALLSPLDLPQNWGDLEFSDDDIPSVSTWRN